MLVIDLNRLVVALRNGEANNQKMINKINEIMAERLIKVQLITGKNIDLFSPKMIGGDILGENGKIAINNVVYLWLV